MWTQLNSTNGGSVHDTVSLARQTECFPNPAGFISGAHLVKGQQKVSAQGRVKKLSGTAGFRSGFFSAQLEAFLFTRVVCCPAAFKQDLFRSRSRAKLLRIGSLRRKGSTTRWPPSKGTAVCSERLNEKEKCEVTAK